MILKSQNEMILTKHNFETLLEWLNTDREIAGQKYETIRFRLKKFFYGRGCTHAEELADETIDRVIKKIDFLQNNYCGEPILYFQAVAKKVFLEYTRKQKEKELPENLADHSRFDNREIEDLYSCLTESLNQIPAQQRRFILEYYSGEKKDKMQRCQQISRDKNITYPAMRVQAYRIRNKLQKVFQKNLMSRISYKKAVECF